MTKKIIKKSHQFWMYNVIDGTLADLQKKINSWIEEYGYDAGVGYCDDEIFITVSREETDEEYQNRITKEQRQRAREEYHEKKEFERLKKKYG